MPSLTLCMLAAHFIMKLKGNQIMEHAMMGVRPVSMGMLLAVAVTLSQSTFAMTGLNGGLVIQWNLVLIAVICGFLLFKVKLSIPKTIPVAAILGIFIG